MRYTLCEDCDTSLMECTCPCEDEDRKGTDIFEDAILDPQEGCNSCDHMIPDPNKRDEFFGRPIAFHKLGKVE